MTTEAFIKTMGCRLQQLIPAAAVLFLIAGCLEAPYDKSAAEKKFVEKQHAAFYHYPTGDRSIHYVAAGKPGAPLVVLIHGTPGSWHAYADLLTDDVLLSKAYLIAVDRPGFGKSGSGHLVTSLEQQAAYLQPVIERESNDHKAILVGHSLGAPIAARIAMDYPDLVGGLVMVAPSLDPDLEKPRWYNNLAASALVAWAVPEELALANKEIMPLSAELGKMVSLWPGIDIPVIVVQGQEDELVAPANADFAERMLKERATIVRVADQGHFILWNQPRLIRNQILELFRQVNM